MKRSLIYLLPVLLFFTTSCGRKSNKSKQENTVPIEYPIPEKPKGWVSDFGNIFTAEQVNVLDGTLTLFEGDTKNEVVIVSLNLDSALIKTVDDFNSFSLALFNKWGVGKKGKDNGVVILISPNLRRTRIEVGKGLVSKLTDQECRAIIDSAMIPSFRNSDYYKGVLEGLAGIAKEIR